MSAVPYTTVSEKSPLPKDGAFTATCCFWETTFHRIGCWSSGTETGGGGARPPIRTPIGCGYKKYAKDPVRNI